MSMKFLSGLQDLLGLYDSSAVPASPQSPSTPIPPTSPVFSSAPSRTQKKTIQELNYNQNDDTQVRRCSHDKKVQFAEELVTGYSEAPHSPFLEFYDEDATTIVGNAHGPTAEEILANYSRVCERSNITPSAKVVSQIGCMHRTSGVRQEILTLKGERVSYADMEALEAIFKMVQFDTLDFEYTFLDDDGIVSLCEMLEFYDTTHKLNLSFNRQITSRGWSAVFRAIRLCHSLQVLNLRYTSIDCAFSIFCRNLRSQPNPALTCLHLENVSLTGKKLESLVGSLKSNNVLRELFLGENNLQPSDGTHLHQLIMGNTSIQMLDLRNNELGDNGLKHICDALKHQVTLTQSALTALVLWNNRISHQSMDNLASALTENHHLETLNIGANQLGLEGISKLKQALAGNANLHRLGLQQTYLNCEAAIVLAECLADNDVMIRVDLRENPQIGSAGLLALHSAMKMNSAITNLNLDEGCTVPTSEKVRPYQDEFRRYFDEIRELCEKNKKAALQRMAVKTDTEEKAAKEVQCNDDHADSETPKEDVAKCPEERVVLRKPKSTRFCRSASLTCQETITDIPERIRQMSGSTHSLDEATNPESVKTIKKSSTNQTILGKPEWGSLPAIPHALQQEAQVSPSGVTAPVVRKTRRFSVSPTSSTFNISSEAKTSPLATQRPHSLSISIPVTTLSPEQAGPMSAPTTSSLFGGIVLENSAKVKETVIEEPEPTSVPLSDNAATAAETEELKLMDEQKHEKESNIPHVENADKREVEVKTVVTDLVNYVVYEETAQNERKASLLLGTCFARPDPELLLAMASTHYQSSVSTPATPSRFYDIAEELSGEESDDQAVQSVVRGLVRDVLKQEKEMLRQTLENRRKQRSTGQTTPSTPS